MSSRARTAKGAYRWASGAATNAPSRAALAATASTSGASIPIGFSIRKG